jgi:NAD(P)-dependent dehydrogenase (short-subunit alcohol dehydrogenase family)
MDCYVLGRQYRESGMAMITTEFGFSSTAEEVLQGIDLRGKSIIVTGGASGIGVETVRALALAGASVTIATRRLEPARTIAADIREKTDNHAVEARHLDLADLASVRQFVENWDKPLHVLINNAGIMALPELVRTPEGREMQFGTNFIGHFALTLGLQPWLKQAENARVVSVASTGNLFGPVFWDDPDFHFIPYDPLLSYAQSKTACILHSVGITQKWQDDGITSNALNPGAIATNLQRHTGGLRTPEPYRKTPEQGAATSVLLAVSPILAGISGRYFDNCKEVETVAMRGSDLPAGVAPYALDPDNADRLWDMALKMIEGK